MFVGLGSQVLPPAFGLSHVPIDESLRTAFVLNIAIILFGWRRSKDLKDALEAYEKAERLAQRNANTDPMTGLANRRELLHCARGGARSQAAPASCCCSTSTISSGSTTSTAISPATSS